MATVTASDGTNQREHEVFSERGGTMHLEDTDVASISLEERGRQRKGRGRRTDVIDLSQVGCLWAPLATREALTPGAATVQVGHERVTQ